MSISMVVVSSTGLAPLAGMCVPGKSISAIEAMGLHAWAIAAHELGHR